LTTYLVGESREVAKVMSAIAREEVFKKEPVRPPACILAGGETTVTIQGDGIGGRCQEFALSFALEVEGLENVVVLAGGTDGTDGPTEVAGALASGITISKARRLGLDGTEYLKRNDSYNFFKQLEDLVITGPTKTNVMDVYVLVVGKD
jgi:glycerate-2-kinase